MIAVLTGYAASLLLALSLLVNNELRFRWLNMFGCLAFIIYGVLITAFPIILTNVILLLINVFYLIKTYNTRENFDLLEFNTNDQIINKLLRFYAKDIEAYFPGFRLPENADYIRFVVLRDMVIANIFIAEVRDDGTATVHINYTIPKYRDFKVGTFIFQREKQYLINQGIEKIVYNHVSHKGHAGFLKRMGFTESNGGMIKVL